MNNESDKYSPSQGVVSVANLTALPGQVKCINMTITDNNRKTYNIFGTLINLLKNVPVLFYDRKYNAHIK